ncbi:MAG: endonuclease/exonuclease/phosphatase family protein [Pseudomonadota bacterium]
MALTISSSCLISLPTSVSRFLPNVLFQTRSTKKKLPKVVIPTQYTATHINKAHLKLLSFNIQAGLNTQTFHEYAISGVRQFLPKAPQWGHLDAIAAVIQNYDVVGLQEVDGGSVRSGYLNQVHYLAGRAKFNYWHQQLNRNWGRFGQHSNGMLSQWIPHAVEEHRLPGLSGRGALIARFNCHAGELIIIIVHLALATDAQRKQIDYLAGIIREHSHVILMGDMNNDSQKILDFFKQHHIYLDTAKDKLMSYPSWSPQKSLDHIFISPTLKIVKAEVIDCRLSDHCPVALEIHLPK